MKSYFLRRIAPFFIRVVVFLLGSKNKKKANASDFFFIVGSGRNGSTLLSSVLNNHPSIFVPPEQYVIPFYSARWQLMRFISEKSFFRKLSHELLLPGKTVNWELDKEDYRKLNDINNWTSFYEIVNKIFRHYAFKKGKQNVKMLGEKSPLMIHYWSLFFTEFIGAKYIFLVRDPRDVIFSFSKVSGHKAN
ncbi:MAG: sulfotransferase, partial [Ekhidna sp.]